MQKSKIKNQKLLLIPLIIFTGIVFFVNSGKEVMAEVLQFTQPPVTLVGTEYVGTLTPGQAGLAYSFQFGATGGTGSYGWYLRPLNGFSLNNQGLLTGAANKAIAGQTYTVRLLVTSGSEEISGTFTLQFISSTPPAPGQPPQITPKALSDGVKDQQYPLQTIEVTGGTPPYSFQSIGSLPGGLSLSPIYPQKANSGSISGIPIMNETKIFQLKATDNASVPSDPVSFSIRVNPASGVPGVPPPGGGAPPAPGSTGGGGGTCLSVMTIQNPKLYQAGDKTVGYDGLVPCGKCVVVSSQSLEQAQNEIKTQGSFSGTGKNVPCQFCHFFVMFGGMVNFLIWKIAIPAAILLLVIGGAMFVFAAGQPGLIKTGKDIMTSVAIGLTIMFAAWLAVNTIFAFLGVADWTGLQQGWFQINCPIKI